jgi:hypothetical protein
MTDRIRAKAAKAAKQLRFKAQVLATAERLRAAAAAGDSGQVSSIVASGVCHSRARARATLLALAWNLRHLRLRASGPTDPPAVETANRLIRSIRDDDHRATASLVTEILDAIEETERLETSTYNDTGFGVVAELSTALLRMHASTVAPSARAIYAAAAAGETQELSRLVYGGMLASRDAAKGTLMILAAGIAPHVKGLARARAVSDSTLGQAGAVGFFAVPLFQADTTPARRQAMQLVTCVINDDPHMLDSMIAVVLDQIAARPDLPEDDSASEPGMGTVAELVGMLCAFATQAAREGGAPS